MMYYVITHVAYEGSSVEEHCTPQDALKSAEEIEENNRKYGYTPTLSYIIEGRELSLGELQDLAKQGEKT